MENYSSRKYEISRSAFSQKHVFWKSVWEKLDGWENIYHSEKNKAKKQKTKRKQNKLGELKWCQNLKNNQEKQKNWELFFFLFIADFLSSSC